MIRHLIVVAVLAAAPSIAAAQTWVEGRDYIAAPNPESPRDDGKITVTEFFWYGCPSCYALEPHLNDWLATKPADVEFTRYAASLSQAWRLHARAYYTAESLDVVDKVHGALFHAIHEDRDPLDSADAIAEVFADAAGVDADAFQRAYDSFGVETRLRRGEQLARRHQLRGVPTLVVNGKWITSPTMARGYDRAIALVEHLVEMERGSAGAPADAGEPAAAGDNDRDARSTDDADAENTPAQPAEALETSDAPPAGSATALWWVWLLVIVAVAAFVVVAVRRRKD